MLLFFLIRIDDGDGPPGAAACMVYAALVSADNQNKHKSQNKKNDVEEEFDDVIEMKVT